MQNRMSKKAVYAQDDSLKLWVEVINECLFVHVQLYQFDKGVLERLKVAWKHLQTAAYFDGWEEIFTYTKDPRIVNIIGGAEELDVPDKLTNAGFRMFKWELK